MNHDPVYARYWERKRLLESCPHFPVIRCSGRFDGDVLQTISKALSGRERLLDVGAGSLAIRDALIASGFTGRYATLDVGSEATYDYRSLDEVDVAQPAILLLDVIEHLQLRDGLRMLEQAVELLEPGGVLVVQTPNGRCVRSPFASDMTHVHAYNLPDLWAFVTSTGCSALGYRVAFEPSVKPLARARRLLSKAVTTQLLGLDYAENVLIVATKRQ